MNDFDFESTPLDRVRGRALETFTPDPAGSRHSFSCRICGVGPLTDLGRYAHLRFHDDATIEVTKMHETVLALFSPTTQPTSPQEKPVSHARGTGTHPWVQPIVVSKTGTHLETIVAAAKVSLRVWSLDHTDSPLGRKNYEAWLSGPFTKTVRRASYSDISRILDWADDNSVPYADEATEDLYGTVLAFPPMRYEDMPKEIGRLQVNGTDFERTAQTVHDDRNTPVTLAVNADLTTGKAAAAAAHALWAWALDRAHSEDPTIVAAYDAWTDAGYPIRVTLLSSRDLAGAVDVPGAHPIFDAGLTEVEPQTLTSVALPMPRHPLTCA